MARTLANKHILLAEGDNDDYLLVGKARRVGIGLWGLAGLTASLAKIMFIIFRDVVTKTMRGHIPPA